MHPRHPYLRKKPDFSELSKKHPFLAPFVSVENGKGHIDFKNKDALRALSRALLLEDFGLDVIIPVESLVPVIPQRLNYILWLEDIFNRLTEPLRGVDIGTGATAIYALLCARKNNWKMVGTDIVEESVEFAKKNIDRNDLSDLVEAKFTQTTPSGAFFGELEGHFHFSMCNPPFFSTLEETDSLGKSRNLNRPSPSAAKTGTPSELVAEGGEAEFVSKMIKESSEFAAIIGVFTTMIGIKEDLKFLVDFLKSSKVLAHTTTTFVQGKTRRWGLAWTFDPKYVPLLLPPKSQASLPVKVKLNCRCSFSDFTLNVKRMFSDLGFRYLKNVNNIVEVIGTTDTWSNQRRRRREAARNSALEAPGTKKMKTSDDPELPVNNEEFPSAKLGDFEGKTFALHCEVVFHDGGLGKPKEVEVKHLGGTLGIEGLHQVLQYLRNIYAKHTCPSAK